jgi:hypothetical protein
MLDPDPYPDPHTIIADPKHWFLINFFLKVQTEDVKERNVFFSSGKLFTVVQIPDSYKIKAIRGTLFKIFLSKYWSEDRSPYPYLNKSHRQILVYFSDTGVKFYFFSDTGVKFYFFFQIPVPKIGVIYVKKIFSPPTVALIS